MPDLLGQRYTRAVCREFPMETAAISLGCTFFQESHITRNSAAAGFWTAALDCNIPYGRDIRHLARIVPDNPIAFPPSRQLLLHCSTFRLPCRSREGQRRNEVTLQVFDFYTLPIYWGGLGRGGFVRKFAIAIKVIHRLSCLYF